MKNRLMTTGAAFVSTIGLLGPVHAADIDLFTTADGNAAPPNVQLVIDNSANWDATIGSTTKKEMEHAALEAVFTADDIAGGTADTGDVKIRLGIGLFADGNSPKGGVVYSHVEDLTPTYQDEIKALLYDADRNEILPKTNNAPYALSFNEVYRYFGQLEPQSGVQNDKIDHDPDAIADDGTYKTPAAGNCGKNFQILIGNGEPDSGEDNDAEDKLDALGGKLSGDPIDVDPDNFESNWSDEYARFMAGADVVPEDVVGPDGKDRGEFEQNVRTYVIDVHDPDSNQAGNKKFESARSWLKSIAKWGDGRYFTASSEEEIKDALRSILNEIFAVNSVFASSTLPVSVNVRGTNLNQVYMGVFRPSETNQTRWQGNLKLYQLAVDEDTNTLFLADKNGEEAQSPATGFIKHQAVSFWTSESEYWNFDPRGVPQSESDKPDGAVVEKGGVHQRVRDLYGTVDSDGAADKAVTDRPLFTFTSDCVDGSGCVLEDFSTNHGSLSDSLVDWMHGLNNTDDDTDPDTKAVDPDTGVIKDPRPSVHGDVLHSKPAVVNYGDLDGDGENDVFVFYGANDGIFHAVSGGKEDTQGEEKWGFIPPEFFGKLDALRNRADGKEYFADGGVGLQKVDNDGDGLVEPGDGDRVRLFISMRRGGRLIYALDVTDPGNPKFLWKATPDSTGYGELGQTWSEPNVSTLQYTDSTGSEVTRDVVVFGGGYDPAAEDPDNTAPVSQGRAIYVVDAEDGTLLWQAGPNPSGADNNHTVADMTFPIPSDVTVLDSDNNGFDDRVYVGDTGGQVWRADISGPPTDWDVHRIASVGEAAGLDERKFLYPPDVVFDEEADGTKYHAVLLGSGDREDPYKTSVTNRFYMFKDKAVGLDGQDLNLAEGDLYDATENLIQASDDETTVENEKAKLANAEGWFLTLENPGEKVVSSAVTLSGTTFFNTNEPPDENAGCAQSLGTARFYEVAFDDATATIENNNVEGLQTSDRTTKAAGGGFPPSPVPVIVEIDGEKYQAVISGTETKNPPGANLERRNPVYWQTHIDE